MSYPSDSGSYGLEDGDVVLDPPPYLLHRHEAAVLDPSTAVRLPGQTSIRSTVYAKTRLLIRAGSLHDATVPALSEAANTVGARVRLDSDRAEAVREAARRADAEDIAERVASVRLVLEPPDDRAYVPADAWAVLQAYRYLVGTDSELAEAVALDHILTATSTYVGSPYPDLPPTTRRAYSAGSPYTSGSVIATQSGSEYGSPGAGARTPVSWFGREPERHWDLGTRRPVVALLDSGVGSHPWLRPDLVEQYSDLAEFLGVADGDSGFEDPLRGSSGAEHGTFMAGLIRQTCAEANLLCVRVMHGDGAVAESDINDALTRLLLRQYEGMRTGNLGLLVDVVVLACGYYHEQPDDVRVDPVIASTIAELGRLGVVVVAAAGNDATSRPMLPAALAPTSGNAVRPDSVPMISVGALNPDHTIALFSNAGPWVTALRPGAASVSIMPSSLSGSMQPTARLESGSIRSTIDPDNFVSGFATWSGTSFSAAVLAGEVAQALLNSRLDDSDAATAVSRGWGAIAQLTGLARP